MKKEELSQLASLRREIRELDEKIAAINARKGMVVTDKVQASAKEFPYQETHVTIHGYSYELDPKSKRQKKEKERLLRIRRQQASELELKITEYINTITDSEIRRMMEYRYIENYTWEEIGRIFHCDRTTAEKKVSNYLKEHPEN